jgi:restriction system protein
LLELLTETIPRLFKSKSAVLDFFQGAGTPGQYLADWRLKVRTDRDSVKKHEITRDVLRQLNEGGDATLKQRREVIKRVSEFDDFSTCYDNDRLRAQGLVAQVRQLVNVEDSFSRMNIERERERKQRQDDYKRILEVKQKEAEERSAIKDHYTNCLVKRTLGSGESNLKLLSTGFLHSLDSRCARRSRSRDEQKGIVEQIDDAVELDGSLYLVEMKWWHELALPEHRKSGRKRFVRCSLRLSKRVRCFPMYPVRERPPSFRRLRCR